MTLEEFVNSLMKTEKIESKIWLEQFNERIVKKQWERIKNSPLDKTLVISFAWIMTSLIRERIDSISTKKLYNEIIKQGHAFLREIYQKAVLQGIDVKENEIDSFLTYNEMMAAAGYLKVENNMVTLTEKGEKADESVAKEMGSG